MATLDATLWQQWAPNATVTCLTASDRYVCAALEYSNCVVLKVWRNSSCSASAHQLPPDDAMELTGHAERVNCAVFHGDILCTASVDCILMWRIKSKGSQIQDIARAMLVDKPRYEVNVMCFDASGTLLALVYHAQVEVLQIHSKSIYITLEGHTSKITCCLFHPVQPHVLISASEDRTFKVWDLADQKLTYQSPILSAYSILSMLVNMKTGDICCGFGDGTVRIYHKYAVELAVIPLASILSKLEKQQQIHEYVNKTLQATHNVVSSLPSYARSQQANESANARNLLQTEITSFTPLPISDVVEISCTILSMHCLAFNAPETTIVDAIQGIFIGTTNYLVFVDANSFECRILHSFQAEVPVAVRVAKQIAFVSTQKGCELWIAGAFLPCITRLFADVNLIPTASTKSNLSILPQAPPPETSILNLPPLESQSQATKPAGALKDQPVTFHTRIKSSGYGADKPKSLSLKFKGLRSKTPPKSSKTSPPPTCSREYPVDCNLITQLDSASTKSNLHHGGINSMAYSSDGRQLATCGNDRLGQITTKSNDVVLVGHENYVKTIQWSHSNRFLLTTSTDKSARVWCPPNDTPSIVVSSKTSVQDGSFYYQDKFLVLAMSNQLKLYQFYVDDKHAAKQKRSDIERLENRSRTKPVATYTFEALKTLTSISCANHALSHLIVTAGSDKSVRIVDASVGKTVRVIPQAHATRAPHTVLLPQTSSYVSHPSNLYDLMLTAACDSAIHLWDIRADNCILRFGEHLNRVHTIGVAFSPCMRYVAAGSEDKVAYMYDIRTGRTLEKLHGHTDVVSCVAFHPWRPRLATAAVDGTVRFYDEARAS